MCTLTVHHNAEPVTMHDHPLARIMAAVRERIQARKLNFLLADRCLHAARDHYHLHGSVALAITEGQRMADKIAGADRHHDWRGNNPSPEAA